MKLGDALTFAGVPERIHEPAAERFVTLRTNGRGAVQRNIASGKTPVPFTGYRVKGGQFIYSRIDARNGAFAIVPSSLDGAVVSKDFPVFDIRRERVDPSYLNHFFRAGSLQSSIQALSRGATNRQRVDENRFLQFPIPLPPINEQRRIAAILDQAEHVRTRFVQVMEDLRLLQSASFESLVAADDWPEQPFSELCSRITVGVVVRPADHYVQDGVVALRTLNVKAGRLDLRDLVYFSSQSNDGPLAKSRLRTGDLVIARTGNAGVTATVPNSLNGANAIDLIVATPNYSRAESRYLEALLNSQIGARLVRAESRGQIQQHLNVGSLKAAVVPVPPIDLQSAFAARVAAIDAQRVRVQRAIDLHNELFASLQSRAFKGEL